MKVKASRGEAGFLASLFFIGTGLCLWWRWHRPERVPARSVFRCKGCGRVGESLDDFVPGGGVGYVNEGRPILHRHGGKAHSVTRDGTEVVGEGEGKG